MAKVNSISFICGKKGSGKTKFAASLARGLFARGHRLIIVDPTDGYQLPGVPIIRSLDPDHFHQLAGRSAIVKSDSRELMAMAIAFAWHVQEGARRPLWLIVDEVHIVLGWSDPDPFLMKVISFGRHRLINLIAIAQRPAQIHKDLLANCDHRFLFQVIEPNDLAYLKKYAGVDPEAVKSLPLDTYLHV